MKKLIIAALVGATVWTTASFAGTETYKIDPVHSSVGFKIRHFFSKVPGQFKEFEGTIVMNKEDVAKSVAEATIKTASIDTKNEKRDGHLKSADFFDVEKYPTI